MLRTGLALKGTSTSDVPQIIVVKLNKCQIEDCRIFLEQTEVKAAKDRS